MVHKHAFTTLCCTLYTGRDKSALGPVCFESIDANVSLGGREPRRSKCSPFDSPTSISCDIFVLRAIVPRLLHFQPEMFTIVATLNLAWANYDIVDDLAELTVALLSFSSSSLSPAAAAAAAAATATRDP
jgi:hypothetical protein